MRVVQRASDGGARSSLLSLGLPGQLRSAGPQLRAGLGQQLGQKEGNRRGELGLAAAVSVGREERRGESRLGWFEKERKKDFPF